MQKVLWVLFSLAILILPAAAAAAVEITSQALIEVEVVNERGGKEIRREAASRVIPGTEVIFINVYVNKGEAPADHVYIDNPISENMDYIEGSALGEGTDIAFSVDGGLHFDTPENLTISESGRRRPATSGDYTHIRWQRTSPLAPGETGEVEFRARVR